jgi:hypothetical protein
VIAILLQLGCTSEPPLPLPQPEQPVWQAKGRMVSAADLRGYLVTPQTLPAMGVLVLVDDIDDAARAHALALAEAGELVLLLPPSVETARGVAYLDGLSTTRGVRTLCQRASCP